MKGIVITTDDQISVRDFGNPLSKTVGEAVGGYIELVHPRSLTQPYCMIVNEEGLILDLPLNKTGSILYETHKHGSPIVGNIVIMKEDWTPERRDLVGLSDAEVEALFNQFLTTFNLKGVMT